MSLKPYACWRWLLGVSLLDRVWKTAASTHTGAGIFTLLAHQDVERVILLQVEDAQDRHTVGPHHGTPSPSPSCCAIARDAARRQSLLGGWTLEGCPTHPTWGARVFLASEQAYGGQRGGCPPASEGHSRLTGSQMGRLSEGPGERGGEARERRGREGGRKKRGNEREEGEKGWREGEREEKGKREVDRVEEGKREKKENGKEREGGEDGEEGQRM